MERLAIDRMGSVRTFDKDGRLHVETTPISKANICGYFGREIPRSEELGLKPEQTYRLLRDPIELERGAATFNGLPVLDDHPTNTSRVTAADPQKHIVVGSTMRNAIFEDPYLKNGLTIWDGPLIEKIKSGQQRELSCGYDYDADMTPGTYKGEPYDGRMTNIRGNHVALVPNGRAGSDVTVHDTAQGAPIMAETKDKTGCDSQDNALRDILGEDAEDDTIAAIKKLFTSSANDNGDEEGDKAKKSAEDGDDTEGGKPAAKDEGDDTKKPAEDEDEDDPKKKPAEDDDEDKERERKAATDSDINRIVERRLERERQRQRAANDARRDVRPLVGEVHDLDNAADIYRYALSQQGMANDSLVGVNTPGLKALVQAKVDRQYPASPAPIANDSASLPFTPPRQLG
ncbi:MULTISPECIES: DUF2213 domain-containing protein [unclassified Saccharibacter]|uniref:DUF2213 domain-containing protein n=2 Tax=Saccharibacter TaxID=231052 RepID=UPI00132820ED|nr:MULTISPECIES: DUF2213 domain-containing protein [unclassified Saccharibacter]MXV35968.1 DUF2213 domain-containing protein [Saccharibacter sp. EH611]MXV58923.1 DUF2213 domain-containing protein [Saccharibacter sp. EH70]MXV65892.1 DUF2213 domain-containing protein [Saccharibacter sp. EH60]